MLKTLLLTLMILSAYGCSTLGSAPPSNSCRRHSPTIETKITGFILNSNRRVKIVEARKIAAAINQASLKYDVPWPLVTAVVKVESNFKTTARSNMGARGLMQLIRSTARYLKVKDSFDVTQNIDGGTRYLKELLERYDNQTHLAVAAYNAGPGRVDRLRQIPRIKQTIKYVQLVTHVNKQLTGAVVDMELYGNFQ